VAVREARKVNEICGRSTDDIFGWPDNLEVRSSMTMFAHATDDNAEFVALLDKYYDGREDPPRSPGCRGQPLPAEFTAVAVSTRTFAP
jgi:hypothetical protein